MASLNFISYAINVVPAGSFYILYYTGKFHILQIPKVALLALRLRLWRKGIIVQIPHSWSSTGEFVGKIRKMKIEWKRRWIKLEVELTEDSDVLPKR